MEALGLSIGFGQILSDMRGAWPGFLFSVLGIVCCLFTTGPANARNVEERPWLALEGEALTLYSDVSPKQSRRIFRDLQLYYFVLHFTTNTRPVEPHVPVIFHAFDRATDAANLGKPVQSHAFSRVAPNGYRAIYLGRRKHLSYDLKAAYAGHFFQNRTDVDYPLWYAIGLNEYLASITQRNAVFRVGGSERAAYRWNDSWLRLEDVLDPGDAHLGDDRIWSFRFQSWALYHYLNHGREDAAEHFSAHLPEYLRMRAENDDEVAAFEQGLGIPAAGLVGRMKQFYSRGKHRIPTLGLQDWVIDDAVPEPQPLTPAQSALVLGRLARVMERRQEASRLFAVAAVDAAPTDAAEISCARARLDSIPYAEQIDRIEQTLDTHPTNPACLIDHAEALLEAAAKETSPARVAEYAVKIQESSDQLAQRDPQNAAAFVSLGRSFLLPGQDRARAIAHLVHARNLVRDDPQVRVYLAEAYRAIDQCEQARAELRLVLAWRDHATPPSAAVVAAASMLAELRSTCPQVGDAIGGAQRAFASYSATSRLGAIRRHAASISPGIAAQRTERSRIGLHQHQPLRKVATQGESAFCLGTQPRHDLALHLDAGRPVGAGILDAGKGRCDRDHATVRIIERAGRRMLQGRGLGAPSTRALACGHGCRLRNRQILGACDRLRRA